MTERQNTVRDELDQKITRALRGLKLGRPVPQQNQDDPADEQLLLFLEGKLQGVERDRVEAQLQRSPYSADRVAIMREVLAELESGRTRLSPDEQIVQHPTTFARLVFLVRKGKDEVLQFIRGTDAPLPLQVALAPVRSAPATATSEAQHFYQFERQLGELNAVIKIEGVAARGLQLRLELARGSELLGDGRASLRRRGRLIESVRIREGVAAFANLTADHYEIELTQQDTSLGRIKLDFLPA